MTVRLSHCRFRLPIACAVGLACLAVVAVPRSRAGTDGDARRSVFDMPAAHRQATLQNLQMLALYQAGRLAEAETLARQVAEAFPDIPETHYNLACVLALQGRGEAALQSLAQAVEKGFSNAAHMAEDTDLRRLRDHPRFEQLVRRAEQQHHAQNSQGIPKGAVEDGIALVAEENTRWSGNLGALVVAFADPPRPPAGMEPVKGQGDVGNLLRTWYAAGMAAGNHGDFYDNHDGGHSTMTLDSFPQITRIRYSGAARSRGLHHGLQSHFLFNQTTIGNSSTAITQGWNWRSQARFAMVQPGIMRLAALQYRANHLYFYPEHRDYKDRPGDVYPANHPYYLISRGSSGSDRPFMDAAAAILAAFQPDTKDNLVKAGLLMPTVQMVFRRNLKGVENDGDYLSGKAHPAAFASRQIDLERMVRYAQGIEPETLPPLAVLGLKNLNAQGAPGWEAPPRAREVQFATPQAISLIYRRPVSPWTFEVSAQQSTDPMGRPLTIAWRVLQAPPGAVRIETDDGGRTARISVNHFDPFPVRPGSSMTTSRVDIGCFVHNGAYWSSPAFVSIYVSGREDRTYDERGRIRYIDYMAHPGRYDDPLIFPKRNWRDEFFYTETGQLLGWVRRSGAAAQRFTRHGLLVDTTDEHGRPLTAQHVHYLFSTASPDEPPEMRPQPLPRYGRYEYDGPEDRLGTLVGQ